MQLIAPTFQNTWTTDTNTKVRRSLDGTLQTPRDPNWATIQSFKMDFEGLRVDERDALLTFLKQTAGQLVTITDFEGSNWTGVIRNEEIVFMEGRDPACTWATSLEFVGHKA